MLKKEREGIIGSCPHIPVDHFIQKFIVSTLYRCILSPLYTGVFCLHFIHVYFVSTLYRCILSYNLDISVLIFTFHLKHLILAQHL